MKIQNSDKEFYCQILLDAGLTKKEVLSILHINPNLFGRWRESLTILYFRSIFKGIVFFRQAESMAELCVSAYPRTITDLTRIHRNQRKDECGLCGEDLNQLHIHHEPEILRTSYRRGTYDNSAFKWKGEIFTLCQSCHAKVSRYFEHLCVQKIKELDIEKEIWAEVHKKFKY